MKKARDIIKFKETMYFAIKMQRNSSLGNCLTFDSRELLKKQRTLRKEINEIKQDLED